MTIVIITTSYKQTLFYRNLYAACVFFWMSSSFTYAKIPDSEIQLSAKCPPYFQLNENNQCKLSTLYDLYPSVNSQWGGYRVALPDRRDGFSPQQIDLGRYLFFDSVLSADKDISCAHCHHPDFSLADGKPKSIGRHGKELSRGSPMLWNMAFQQQFFWDSRASSLEDQIKTVFATASEMAISPQQIVTSLNAIPVYQRFFFEAFGSKSVEFEQVLTAIVAFETSLVSLNSAYDSYIHGAQNALSTQQLNGLHIFRSFASRCSQCHTPPLFTSGQLTTTGIPAVAGEAFDIGAEAVTGEVTLRGAFKVPSLRNISRSAPFMHGGQFKTLKEAVDFYNNEPGHALNNSDDLILHWHMVNPNLKIEEVNDLVAFLEVLTDETAVPRVPARVPSGLPVP